MTSALRELEAVVLTRDLERSGLRAADLGTIVHVNAPESYEVEFVTASGRTESLITLAAADIRPVRDNDLLAVRPTTSERGAV